MKIPQIQNGIYKHYKNKKEYEVLGIAFHTETEEYMVLYRPLYQTDFEYFIRPYEMFSEKVIDPDTGKKVSRFQYKENI